jgi:His-Xaa-Ser system radical SAM maturase HxsC
MGLALMLTLRTKASEAHDFPHDRHLWVMRVSVDPKLPMPLRYNQIFLATQNEVPAGYAAYAMFDPQLRAQVPLGSPSILLPKELDYIAHHDVMAYEPGNRAVRVLYRRNSSNNFFFVTERCNHYCLMCSQPPRDVDDSWLIDEMLAALPLIDPETRELGFTGGEPTLLGDKFLRVLRVAKNYLPRTSLHVLSNGRRFANEAFAKAYADIQHPDMMVGIPLYSDVSNIHDYVVQSDGAYDETIRGILNLKRLHQKVEIRVVIHRQTYSRLPQLAEFLARNLTMVDQVALMGLEMTGFTRANLPALWIDPLDYQKELKQAVQTLDSHRMRVSIYNHQLCLIDRDLWPFARKSISDWKNEYMPECEGCAVRDSCGGFFSSAKLRYSDHINAIQN